MTKYSLNDIIKMISELASKINAPGYSLPTYNFPIGDATPYIEVDNDGYMYFIISERGTEFSRKSSTILTTSFIIFSQAQLFPWLALMN